VTVACRLFAAMLMAAATTLHTARQAVYHDRAHPSAILLPVVSGL
jgi:hypothetical protein